MYKVYKKNMVIIFNVHNRRKEKFKKQVFILLVYVHKYKCYLIADSMCRSGRAGSVRLPVPPAHTLYRSWQHFQPPPLVRHRSIPEWTLVALTPHSPVWKTDTVTLYIIKES